ncbi:MAG: hypothetical protein Q8N44_18560 [Rubrivivax sp.]|nr:hypothetical protein [Rubrivivax sp.]
MTWRRGWTGLLLGLALLPATAMWAGLTDAELLARSDLVVIGEWQGAATLELPPPTGALTLGVIRVNEVIKGDPGLAIALVLQPAAGVPRSSSDLIYRRGDRGLWLLRARPGAAGQFLVDHPQRFVPVADTARIDALRAALARR